MRKHLGELKEVERPIAADQNQIDEDWLVNMHTDSGELDRGHGTNPGPNVQGIRPKVDLKRKSHCTRTVPKQTTYKYSKKLGWKEKTKPLQLSCNRHLRKSEKKPLTYVNGNDRTVKMVLGNWEEVHIGGLAKTT